MSIRWIRNVLIDGEESVLEIQLGYKSIGDRCYTRVGAEMEEYYTPFANHRSGIVEEGIAQLQSKLINSTITTAEGAIYGWQ